MDNFAVLDHLGFSFFALTLIFLLAVLLSSYVKLVTVFSILRAGFGLNSLPSSFITAGLAFVMSLLVMYPTIHSSLEAVEAKNKEAALSPSPESRYQALEAGLVVWKKFLSKHVGREELDKFTELSFKLDKEQPADKEASKIRASSLRVLAPAFMISELKKAFATGLNLFLPFLIIELLVAHLLVGLGIPQLQPSYVALPFKLLLFVLLDGWSLISGHLISTY